MVTEIVREMEEEFNALQKLMNLKKVSYYVPKADGRPKVERPPQFEKSDEKNN